MYDKKSNGVKKILYFITQSELGGAQRYVFDLANNIKGDFKVAVAIGEQGNKGKLAKILQENNIEYFVIRNLKRKISPINDIIAFFKIIKLINIYKPDIIHLNSSKISVLGSLASLFIKSRDLRIIYTVHGWVFNEPLPDWQKNLYIKIEKYTAKFKNKIICVSEYDKCVALNYKVAPAEKLITIHNGIAPIEFYEKEEAKKILISKIQSNILKEAEQPVKSPRPKDEKLNPASFDYAIADKLLIGSIGNLYKTKGFEYLIEAADIIINKNKITALFIIIGRGSELKNLTNLIKKYNLEYNFILAGGVSEASKLLKAFDIYICSSVKEGLPYSILEAMSAGLPIITTSVGGIPEMIVDPSTDLKLANGSIAMSADAQGLAMKIMEFAADKTLAAILGEKSKQDVNKNFGLEKMVTETKKVYLE